VAAGLVFSGVRRTAVDRDTEIMAHLQVKSVRSGSILGRVELAEDGTLTASSPDVQRDIDRMAAARGWSPQEAFENLRGWSNGYIQIIAVD
jgi:hypothetical protein